MYEVLAARVPQVEPYSVDEMFRDAVKSARAMAALDAVNARFGSGMIKTWAGRQARHSPRYTTRAEEMLVAQAF
ncbi:protein of unknown function [Acidocella aminolytica 101 = DSM 11237]|uniref:DUF4113 domain-containing protein n=1 Tax=Acidocella aminolytica 101 = DSM 11237 TaxID=1120923 RepID=A0A0D6PHD2_9PROT|nr:DUF4113 domain-containing protein [Acidocella aminolytica]GAN81165.1 hypothetical protein Aam_081_001 [Acidocella aminolytica 101 = DSM 11237]GBQ43377.1 hypothetical protein AA11237_3265 [Acidocella aminolytica 101 = DSM 11237]SHF58949.1 protein of unknown function [Acidocella aminolytica 101 = DSM 11237]